MADSPQRVPVKGHPGIFKKGNRYVVRYRVHGQLHSKSLRTLAEAKRFKGKADSGEARATTTLTFQAYAPTWLDSYTGRTARGASETTMAGYRDAIQRLAIPFFGTTRLDRIDPPMLRRFIAELAAAPSETSRMQKTKALTPASVRAAYAPVRALLRTAHGDGLISSDPTSGLRVIVKDTRARTPKWLSAEQTKQLLAAMPEEHADLAYFLASTGCRISEALHACWEDIAAGSDGRILWTVRKSKTEAGLRDVVLSAEALRRLNVRRSKCRFQAPGDPIFPTSSGTTIDPHNWRRDVFKPAAVAAGVEWATPHKLRHGVASLMANQGMSAAQIADRLGHADGGVLAMRTYIHPERPSVDFIDQLLA